MPRRPWTAEELALLGTDTDAAVARRIGRTQTAVYMQRRKLGLAPGIPHTRTWTKAELRLLGKHSDAEVASRLGVSRKHVLEMRRRRGVPAFSPKNRPRFLDD